MTQVQESMEGLGCVEEAQEQALLERQDVPWSANSTVKRRSSSQTSQKSGEYTGPQAGLNYGSVNVGLYKDAMKHALKRERELAEIDALAPNRKLPETNALYHYIHGKAYDLRPFYNSHPGGADILQLTAGLPDATPAFESYHAFADRDGILERIKAYRVPDHVLEKDGDVIPKELYAFDEDGFYRTLTRRVRAHFTGGSENDPENKSVTDHIKADWVQFAKIGFQVLLNLVFFSLAFLIRLPLMQAMVCGFLSGFIQMGWGFTAMHDACHFALGKRNHWLNERMLQVWMGWSLWNSKTWMIHHVSRHHLYTGTEELDPDTHHSMPVIRKCVDTPYHEVNKVFDFINNTFGFYGTAVSVFFLSVLAPGMYLGQAMEYLHYREATSPEKETLWGMAPFKSIKGYDTPWWESAIFGSVLVVHLVRMNPLVTWSYTAGFALSYAMCILADHDLVESALTAHVDTDAFGLGLQEKMPDWGEVQVRNTTNFINDYLNIFAQWFGGINYQIEHHLFPGMAHMKLVEISPIVQQTCEEFDVPYTTYPNISDAWGSYVVSIRAIMSGLKSEQEIEKVRHL